MAITAAELEVIVSLNDQQFRAGMKQAETGMASFTRSMQGVTTALAGLGLATIGKEIASLGLDFLALKEQAQIAFSTMLGSGQLAASFLKELEAFAARTPFEFPDLLKAAQRLTAMGFAARDVIPMLTAIGDAAAAMGASSATIDRITLALGQMAAKGKVSHEEMRQLAEVGIPVWQILADKIGKTVPEAMKLAEKGMLDGKKAVNDLIDGIQNGTKNVQAFAGMMDKQSKTFSGLASTLKDLGRQAIGEILNPAFNKLRDIMARAVEILPKAVEWFQKLDEDVKNGALAFAALVTVGPLVVGAIGLIGTALSALLSPIGLVIAAIGALAVAYASNLGGIRDAVGEFTDAVVGLWSGHGTELLEITNTFWGEIRVLFIDNFHRIAEGIRVGSNIIKGEWGEVGKGLIEITMSFMTSIGDIIFNFTERILPKFLTDAARKVRDFATTAVRDLLGIQNAIPKGLEFKAPSNVPGLPSWQVIAETDKALMGLTRTMPKVGGAARKMKEELSEAEKELKKWTKEMEGAVSDLNKALNVDKGIHDYLMNLGKIPAPAIEAVNALDELKAAEKELEGVSESAGKIIGDTEPYVRAAGAANVLKLEFEKLSRSLPQAWNTIIDGFVKGGSAMSVKVKGFAADIINVFDTMPGKWGNSLRRTLDVINQWISFLDSAIKLVQRMLGDEQTGLSGIISGVFKKTSESAQDASEKLKDAGGVFGEFGTEMQQAGASAQKGASSILAGLAGIASGVLAFAGIKGGGAGQGAVTGALGALAIAGGIAKVMGIAFKSLFTGPAAPFVIAGLGVGAILGAIFGRKSDLQKAQEAAALQQAKDAIALSMQQVLKGAQEVIQSSIDSFMKALEFFNQLDEFTAVRKAKFQEFWRAMTRLLNGFFELAKQFAGQSMPQLKAVAETLKPIAETIGAMPMAFEAINGHFGVAQAAIDRFFADFSTVMEAFFQRSEVWIDGISKRAMKVANRLSPVVQLISAFGQAMTDITGVKEPTDEMFAIFDRVIDKIVTHVANLSLKFDKAVLKTMANFAEKAGAALAIWKEAIESIRATVDITTPSEADVNNVVVGIEMFVSKLSDAVGRLINTDLARVSAFASTIAPIAAAIKAWAETAEVVRGYTAIAAEVWEAIVADFERGLVLLNLLILDAELYVEKANTFKSLIEEGASTIASALSTYAGSIANAASALGAGLPQGGTPLGASAASSFGTSSATSFAASQTSAPVIINVAVQGSVIENERLADTIVRILHEQGRRGRLVTI